MEKNNRIDVWSTGLINASMLLYLIWLLLPAVQTTGGALGGAACVGLFGLGVLLDWQRTRERWLSIVLRAVCAAAMPLVLRLFLRRGGNNFLGFYVQQAMFWFPLVFAGYVRERADRRLWRWVKWVLLAAVCVTVATTIGWLIEGMLRGGRVYAYSRSLGYAGEGREAYLKELMLRNIGGYDFVYAMVAALPFACIGIVHHTGWRRGAYAALLTAQTVMIVLSQYTYAMLFAAAILAVQMFALIVRKLSRGRIGMGRSLLLGAVPLVLAALLMQPLAALAAKVCMSLGLTNFAFSFEQLLLALKGGATSADSRLGYYLTAVQGFLRSPLMGSMLGGEKLLSQHSEVLDLLSGMGLMGTALVGCMVWLMGRGALRGVKQHPDRAQLALAGCAVLAVTSLGTVFYSRDVMAVAAMGLLLVMEEKSA